jgi:ABC-type sugar transport system ATPase subunit
MREYSKIGEQKVEVASRMSTSNQTLSLNEGSGAMERRRMVVSSTRQNPAIEARNLVKTYPRGVRAVDDLSFSVETGTIFGLLGPNGAGKSTTVKILTTLSRPDSGEARIAGIDVLREPDHVRRVIGCVAQRSGVDREATARENLMLRIARSLRLDRSRESRGWRLLRRYAAAARYRHGTDPSAERPLPR